MAEPNAVRTSPVDTKRVPERRQLRFETIEDALADAEAMAAAAREGRLRQLGNWTLGQTLGHLATWVGYAYDGLPVMPPLLVRWIMRPMKNRFLHKGMPAGVRIPGTPAARSAPKRCPSTRGWSVTAAP